MNVLITGATGFLGQHAVHRLTNLGFRVRGLGRNQAVGNRLEKSGMEFFRANLEDRDAVMQACEGMDYVLHCGALSSPWGRYEEFYQANVEGTKNVLSGCLKHGIKRMVHLSTPSLYFDFRDRLNIAESDTLPVRSCNAYAATKRLAEELVDQAEGLDTITLRPRGIFGPGDLTILPRIIEANRRKRLPLFRGGKALIDMIFVDNVVDAMLLSLEAPKHTRKKKYNLSNGEPMEVGNLLKELFQGIDEPFLPKPMPYPIAYGIGWIMEALSWKEPPFTRYTLSLLAKSQTLCIQSARKDLGYHPRVTMKQGIALFAEWWKHER